MATATMNLDGRANADFIVSIQEGVMINYVTTGAPQSFPTTGTPAGTTWREVAPRRWGFGSLIEWLGGPP